MLTPEKVFIASGHVEKFSDLMVKNIVTGHIFRADHLLKDFIETRLSNPNLSESERQECNQIMAEIDSYKAEQLDKFLYKYYNNANKDEKYPYSFVEPMNLMFKTQIGAIKNDTGYLRPETAQGIFLNFKRLLEYNSGKLPFGGVHIGHSFRNEISPRSGLIRCREFLLAEIEYFYDNLEKHTDLETSDEITQIYAEYKKALGEKTVKNPLLSHFMHKAFAFLHMIGIPFDWIRVREHHKEELAHYANEWWDLEVLTSYGWIEVVGKCIWSQLWF